MIKPDTLLGPYTIGKQLGMGSFATVYLCKYKKEKYAVKVVSKQNKESHELLFKGHQILKAIHSIDNEFDEGKRHIVEFVDVVETDDYFGVVLELIPGIELFDYVMAHHRIVDEVALGLEEPIARNIMKQLLKVHGDVKLENVMVISNQGEPFIKLIDFGLGHFVHTQNGVKGTEAYQSPETIMNQQRDPFKSDIWAAGIILFAMLTSRLPFDRKEELDAIASSEQGRRSMLRRIATGAYQYRPAEMVLSEASRQVIKSMLARNQEYRNTASELLNLPWFL